MTKIMFFAHDPGGANAIKPLIEPLKKEHEVVVSAKGPAVQKLDCDSVIGGGGLTLSEVMPDILITGTSANDFTEKELWREAKSLGIKSMAILDHWVNYGIRFSKYGLKDVEKFDKKCDYLPDYIIVMDEFAKSEMIKDGVPGNIIYPLGNPHFQNIRNHAETLPDIRTKFAGKDDILITYASEPYIEDYGKGEEINVLKDLADIVKDENVKILVKLHPKESLEKYAAFAGKNVILDKESSPLEVIKASDIVISMTSMFLIEALILSKNVLSYQPKETSPDKFILTKNGALPFINNKEDFNIKLHKMFTNKSQLNYDNKVNFDGIDKVVKFVEEQICKPLVKN